jgi:hypothetical protein
MSFPNNSFAIDQLESDQYGGRPNGANTFDAQSWTWITGLVRAIEASFFSHVRVSWDNIVAVVQNAVAIGDVIAIDLSRDYSVPSTQQQLPWIDKYSTIVANAGTPKILGVAVSQAAALGKAQIATGGLLPQSVTGLTSQTAGNSIEANSSTSRLQPHTSGTILGYTSPNGNLILLPFGRTAA